MGADVGHRRPRLASTQLDQRIGAPLRRRLVVVADLHLVDHALDVVGDDLTVFGVERAREIPPAAQRLRDEERVPFVLFGRGQRIIAVDRIAHDVDDATQGRRARGARGIDQRTFDIEDCHEALGRCRLRDHNCVRTGDLAD